MTIKKILAFAIIAVIVLSFNLGFAATPPKVTGVKLKTNKSNITVSWNKTSGTDRYQIAYKNGKEKAFRTRIAKGTATTIKPWKNGIYKVKVRGIKHDKGIYGMLLGNKYNTKEGSISRLNQYGRYSPVKTIRVCLHH